MMEGTRSSRVSLTGLVSRGPDTHQRRAFPKLSETCAARVALGLEGTKSFPWRRDHRMGTAETSKLVAGKGFEGWMSVLSSGPRG